MKMATPKKMAIPTTRVILGVNGVRSGIRALNRVLAAGGGKDTGVGDTP